MLKKNSGIATTYFKLNSHRVNILNGNDNIISNKKTVTKNLVDPNLSKYLFNTVFARITGRTAT